MNLDVCLSPALFNYRANSNKIVVVIDVIRASTSITTALAYGAKKILPLADIEETRQYRQKKYLIAGERKGYKIDDFDLGNSPYDFMTDKIKNRSIAMTTTNGTYSIKIAQNQNTIIIGSFVNYKAILNYLRNKQKDVILLCAGTERNIALEDVALAGKLAEELLNTGKFNFFTEAVIMALETYQKAKYNLYDYVLKHSPRLQNRVHFLKKDIKFCFVENKFNTIPVLKENYLVINVER